jgi:predicted permease
MASLLDFGHDARYALRVLRQNPLFTAAAVTSLALGIGANLALFTLTNAILLRSLPVTNPQELVVLGGNPPDPHTGSSYPDYLYLRDHSDSYAGLIALWSGGVTRFNLRNTSGPAELVALSLVSGNYFEVLGVTPALGRLFNSADNVTAGAHPYVVLSHAFWKSAFGGDSGVIGREILLNGARFEVVGVAREGFAGTNVGVAPQVFAPMVMERTFYRVDVDALTTRDSAWITIMGRLKRGVSRKGAEAELNVLWRQILANDPAERARRLRQKNYEQVNTRLLLPGSGGDSRLRKSVSRPLKILLLASGFLLLIACANVANLLVARGVARQREIAVRLALGAGRSRLVIQMLTESITLSGLGAAAGVAVAWLGVRVLQRFLPNDALSPLALQLTPDGRLLGFAAGVTVASGVAFGLLPAMRASGQHLLAALKRNSSGGTGRATRWEPVRLLVSLQVALALVLLAGAGLFARTLVNLRSVDLGMKRGHVLFVDTNMTQSGFTPRQARTYYESLRQKVQELPGVTAASMGLQNPFGYTGWQERVQIEGNTEGGSVASNGVAPRFFEALGIPILRGRDFRDSDSGGPETSAGSPHVAIVNEVFARRFFPGISPIGRRFSVGAQWNPAKVYEIIGVVGNARYESAGKQVGPMIYHQFYREMQWTGGLLCVRTEDDSKRIAGTIRRLAQQVDPTVMVTETRTLEDNLDVAFLEPRFLATSGGFFGAVALLLAAVGIYGAMSQAVTRRTREIGIRMALGAEPTGILWMTLRDACVMLGVGALVGLPAALALTRYAESLLFGVKAHDPLTIACAVCLLASVSLLAGLVPAKRATRVQPMEALKQE